MKTEYEATYLDIDKDEIRKRLKDSGAELVRPEFLQRRTVFDIAGKTEEYAWLRVRDEGDKITMTYKWVASGKIENQKEIDLIIDDFDKGIEFLKTIGCHEKSYQETKREIWKLNNVDICIDEWPFVEPFVEIEGQSEKEVIDVSEKLGFNYSEALFCSVDVIYNKKYGTPLDVINNNIPKITFDMENPFLKLK